MTTEIKADTAVPSALRDRETVLAGEGWVPATGERLLEVVDPSTAEVVARVREAAPADVERAVAAAREAFDAGPWPRWSPEQRADALDALADALQERAAELAEVTTSEVGMPIRAAEVSTARALACLRWFADLARRFPFRTDRVRAGGAVSRVLQEPVGVVACVLPWNGPFATALLKLAPALAAGCTIVLKPSPETPLSAYLLGDVVVDLVAAGTLPPGVVNVLAADRETSALLVDHPGVDKISFTGSTAAGRAIMASAAQRLARVTLELGGKSAAILLDDAPLDTVLPTLVSGGCGNTGQMCFGLTRVLVSQARRAELVEGMAAAMAGLVVGNAHDRGTGMGPLATQRQRKRVEGYVALGREEGATVAFGGGRPKGLDRGWFVEPTLFTGVANTMRIAQEEIFGPVISVITYTDLDDAVAQANASDYGLAGSVYTADPERGFAVAQRVRTGTFSVNGAIFDTTVPFGGYKQSGLGREGGEEGLQSYLETKSVHMPA